MLSRIVFGFSLFALVHLEALSFFSIGPHHDYTQIHFNNPGKIEGYLTGVTADYRYFCDEWMGDLCYEGYWNITPISGNPCQESSIREHLISLRTGWSFFPSECLLFLPYIGGAYNSYYNRQDPSASGGLLYHWKKWSLPIGFETYCKVNDLFTLALFAEWRPDLHARVDVVGEKIPLKDKCAFRIELPLIFCIPCEYPFSIQVVPFYDWNQFGETTKNNSNGVPFPIPTLIRWNLGLRLLIGTSF